MSESFVPSREKYNPLIEYKINFYLGNFYLIIRIYYLSLTLNVRKDCSIKNLCN